MPFNHSTDYLNLSANSIIPIMDRNNIFPPLLKDPSIILSKNKRQVNHLTKQRKTPNAFFICRMNVHNEVIRNGVNVNMRIISKIASTFWKFATSEEKKEYFLIASNVRNNHIINNNSNNTFHSLSVTPNSNVIDKSEQTTSDIINYQIFYYNNIQFYNFINY